MNEHIARMCGCSNGDNLMLLDTTYKNKKYTTVTDDDITCLILQVQVCVVCDLGHEKLSVCLTAHHYHGIKAPRKALHENE
jgi:hypothetical protein